MQIPDCTTSTDEAKVLDMIAYLKELLKSEDNKNIECISIFEVLILYRDKKEKGEVTEAIETQSKYGVRSTNSCFNVSISDTCICVFRGERHIVSDFKIISFCENELEVFVKSKYDEVTKKFSSKGKRLFKNIFVKIADCPEWMQCELKGIREKQIKKSRVHEIFCAIIKIFKK